MPLIFFSQSVGEIILGAFTYPFNVHCTKFGLQLRWMILSPCQIKKTMSAGDDLLSKIQNILI